MSWVKGRSEAEFTAIELAIVMVIASILAAIAAPGWLRLRDRQTVNTVNEELYLAMREAQSQALATKMDWRASFREEDDRVEWSVHCDNVEPSRWQGSSAPVTIEDGTTFRQRSGYYCRIWRSRAN